MDPEHRSENVVARVRAGARPRRRVAPRVVRAAFVVGGTAAGIAAALAPTAFIRGVSLTSLVCIAIGAAVYWLSATGPRLSESGREMGEDWQNQQYAPPPPEP